MAESSVWPIVRHDSEDGLVALVAANEEQALHVDHERLPRSDAAKCERVNGTFAVVVVENVRPRDAMLILPRISRLTPGPVTSKNALAMVSKLGGVFAVMTEPRCWKVK